MAGTTPARPSIGWPISTPGARRPSPFWNASTDRPQSGDGYSAGVCSLWPAPNCGATTAGKSGGCRIIFLNGGAKTRWASVRSTVARCDNVANQPISPDFPINHSITHIMFKELASSSAPSALFDRCIARHRGIFSPPRLDHIISLL